MPNCWNLQSVTMPTYFNQQATPRGMPKRHNRPRLWRNGITEVRHLWWSNCLTWTTKHFPPIPRLEVENQLGLFDPDPSRASRVREESSLACNTKVLLIEMVIIVNTK